MALDLIAVIVLGGFGAWGAIRGSLRAGVALATWVVGNVGAVLVAPAVSPLLERYAGISSPFSLLVAGVGILGAVWLLGTGVVFGVRRWRGNMAHRAGLDGTGGAVFGLLQGAIVVVLLGWLALLADAAARVDGSSLPGANGSLTARISGRTVELALGAALSEDSGLATRMTVRLASRPGESVERIQSLVENPRIAALRDDRLFWSYVRHESYEAALNRGSFLSIAYDETLRHDFAKVGLVDEAAASDPRLFRNDALEMLRQVAPRIQRLAENPEVHALARDPDVQSALESGDTMALLAHPGVRKLLTEVLQDPDPEL